MSFWIFRKSGIWEATKLLVIKGSAAIVNLDSNPYSASSYLGHLGHVI